MERRKLTKIVIILTIISTMITLVRIGSNFPRPLEASSIGIIGGVDGPTAIFLTSRLSPHIFTGIFGLISISGMVYLFVAKKVKR